MTRSGKVTEPFLIHMGFANVDLSGRYKNGTRYGKWTGVESADPISYTCNWQTGIATISYSGCVLTGDFSVAEDNHIRYGDDWRTNSGERVVWKPDCGEVILHMHMPFAKEFTFRGVMTGFHKPFPVYGFRHKASGTMSFGGTRFCRGSFDGMMVIDGEFINGRYIRSQEFENEILQAENGVCYDRSGKRVRC